MSFDHDHPGDDVADHEYATEIHGAQVLVSKVGGGTVGAAYAGHWHYTVVVDGTVVHHASDLSTGMAHTHAEAAELIFDFLGEHPDWAANR
jgi:hypothetical protein